MLTTDSQVGSKIIIIRISYIVVLTSLEVCKVDRFNLGHYWVRDIWRAHVRRLSCLYSHSRLKCRRCGAPAD